MSRNLQFFFKLHTQPSYSSGSALCRIFSPKVVIKKYVQTQSSTSELTISDKERPRHRATYAINKKLINPPYRSNTKPDSVISVNVTNHSIGWLHMDCAGQIKDWQSQILFESNKVQYNHTVWHKKIWTIIQKLPLADVVLMEDFNPNVRQMQFVSGAMKHARLDTMTATLLCFSYGSRIRQNSTINYLNKPEDELFKMAFESEQNLSLYRINPRGLANYYELNVGNERINSNSCVQRILNENFNNITVSVPWQLVEEYRKVNVETQQLLGNCLLQCVMFYDILAQHDNSQNRVASDKL